MAITRIRNDADYRAAMAELEQLMANPPRLGSVEAERLDFLSLLLEEYEKKEFPVELPTPLEAIKFRMEQMRLEPRDLIPYLGTRARVSEVLNGKRPLTLTMMRALNKGLQIPAAVLLAEPRPEVQTAADQDWGCFPVKAMAKLGWIQAAKGTLKDRARELMEEFAEPLGGLEVAASHALFRQTQTLRSVRSMDLYAVQAWCMRVRIRALSSGVRGSFSAASVDSEVLTKIARLSVLPDGPLRAQHAIEELGIHFIVEHHLPKTHLDGAALLAEDGTPILALTLRHDRLDSFWFCLFHELIHILRHLRADLRVCLDDMETSAEGYQIEKEADYAAGEALVPSRVFRNSRAYTVRSIPAVLELASQLNIHPAIVAGRVRHESRDYRVLSQLVGSGEVRRLFPSVFGAPESGEVR
jgi:HTH-type transcriptional regulator / antitoxin HigA